MNNKEFTFSHLIDLIKGLVGTDYLYFDDAVIVKKTPHTVPVNVYAVCVSPNKELFVMDAGEQWHQVEENETNIIGSLFQRVKLLSIQYKIA